MQNLGRAFLAGCMLAGGFAAMAGNAAAAQRNTQAGERVNALTAAHNASDQQLFATLGGASGNVVFSPYSIGTAMAMALTGARGETAAEMSRVLTHRLGMTEIDAANGEVMESIARYDHSRDPWTCPDGMTLNAQQCEAQPAGDKHLCGPGMHLAGDRCVGAATPPRTAKLLTANALMLTTQRGDLISTTYADLLKAKYAAEVFRDARLDDVNAWVSRKTEGKIGTILDRLDDNAAAVLLNAVYFKARWESPFDKKLTRDDAFNLSRSQKIQVPMMSRSGDFVVAARDGYRAIRLPYEIPTLGLVVVLPNEISGLPEVAARIRGADELTQLFAALHGASKPVAFALPRFRAEFKTSLVAPFRQAGMKLAFDPDNADFSGMTGRPPSQAGLYIGQIVHRAVIEVAEESTEAAAATAVVMALKSARLRQPGPEIFHVDRPFLFYLMDDTTGAILFQGRIVDPR